MTIETLRDLRTTCLAVLGALLAVAGLSCHDSSDVASEAGPSDASTPVFDLCDAFTEVGASCPTASPVVCFQECEAGGCFCDDTPNGPRWACVTDRSCLPACAPIDDACTADAPD